MIGDLADRNAAQAVGKQLQRVFREDTRIASDGGVKETDASNEHESPEWYVVRSKPRREEYAQDQLVRRGVETFLPRIVEPGARAASRSSVRCFPGYLFARIDLLTPVHQRDLDAGGAQLRRLRRRAGRGRSGGDRFSAGALRHARASCRSCRPSTTATWCA